MARDGNSVLKFEKHSLVDEIKKVGEVCLIVRSTIGRRSVEDWSKIVRSSANKNVRFAHVIGSKFVG